jgi:hypothetical protein
LNINLISEVLGYLAGLAAISAYAPYILSILRKETRPSRSTWIIWTVASLVLLSSYFSVGARGTIWLPLAYAIGTIIVMLLSLRFGEGGWSKFDKICFTSSFLSLMLWWIFDSPLLALLLNLSIDVIGSFPTMKKVKRDPKSENKLGWTLFFVGVVLNLLSALFGGKISFEIMIYPAVMFTTVGIIFYFVVIHKKSLK